MNEDKLRLPQHSMIRTVLRIGGPTILVVGFLFAIVGFGSFFSSFASFGSSGPHEFPRYFWCAFVGLPLMFLGFTICLFGFIGPFQRYVLGESAPVVKDAVNYMGENIQPGIKSVVKAMTEGIAEGRSEHLKKPKENS